jgi:4a-hydroxytetrahydrobiopterin dehydratase
MKDWIEIDNKLSRTFEFDDFTQALSWMVEAAFIIERHNHHPEWSNIYNKVLVNLCTHDAGNTVTDKDRKLAIELENLYKKKHLV